MHKKELVKRLRAYADPARSSPHANWRQKKMAKYFAEYFERLDIPADTKFEHWDITGYLVKLLTDAVEALRREEEGWMEQYRGTFSAFGFINATDGVRMNGVSGGGTILVVSDIGYMIRDVLAGYRGIDQSTKCFVEYQLEAYCHSQLTVIMQTFDEFRRQVYAKGMFDLVENSPSSYHDGEFGRTVLRTGVTAGRIMFTFARVGKDGHDTASVSFVGEDDDPLLLSVGVQSVHTNLFTAVKMINDVVRNWPTEKSEQQSIFAPSDSVSFI